MRDRYVFSCEQQRCVGAFRVRDVRAFGACGRRPVVEDIDPQAAVIGGLGVVPLFLDRVEFWPGTLLIPAVVVTFLVEGWARYRRTKIA